MFFHWRKRSATLAHSLSLPPDPRPSRDNRAAPPHTPRPTPPHPAARSRLHSARSQLGARVVQPPREIEEDERTLRLKRVDGAAQRVHPVAGIVHQLRPTE